MITEKEKDAALELLDAYKDQQEHNVRDSIKDDCPSKDYEEGKPWEGSMCEGDGHYMCRRCIHYLRD